jgi:hypothetical protein
MGRGQLADRVLLVQNDIFCVPELAATECHQTTHNESSLLLLSSGWPGHSS